MIEETVAEEPESASFSRSASPSAPLSVPEAVRTRRSIRHYLPDPLPPEQLTELLSLTLEAPSSWNVQARSVVVVADQEGRDGLVRATGGQPHPGEAPVTLVFVAASRAWREDLGDIYERARDIGAWNEQFAAGFSQASLDFHKDLEARGLLREYAVKDAVIAATYAMLAAASMGLASSPMNGWDEAEVKKVIGIEDRDDLHIALLLPVGRAAEERRHPGRRPLARHAFDGRYGRACPSPPGGLPDRAGHASGTVETAPSR
ncbi:nitroreductase family protein [Streptomyces rimosus]|uniref:nitroreductase family protein n=1 Tax=Streptomyces rimosus TaxID=1927 RepID=UPI000519DA2C|nr:nitroreductase family protein [Streptomyces rimosus]